MCRRAGTLMCPKWRRLSTAEREPRLGEVGGATGEVYRVAREIRLE
jgi:hypothetical protein